MSMCYEYVQMYEFFRIIMVSRLLLPLLVNLLHNLYYVN